MDVHYVMQRYPVQVTLDDGTLVTIRPLEKGDKIMLADFFQRIPEEDRFYLKENVTAPQVIHNWVEHMDLERVVPLLAVLPEGDVVADATLHRSRAPARRHVGELRVVVESDYRGMGLGARLIEELVDLGRALELDEVFFELVDRRERNTGRECGGPRRRISSTGTVRRALRGQVEATGYLRSRCAARSHRGLDRDGDAHLGWSGLGRAAERRAL